MRRPLPDSKFNPDDLDFYIHDHLNVTPRIQRLGFMPTSAKASRFTNAAYYYDVPLATGYKHERAKRPANFCRIAISGESRAGGDINVYFSFGWLRRTSSVYKVKHTLVEVPHDHFHVRYGFSEHARLDEFETDLATLINTLRTFTFNDLAHLCHFMSAWCRHAYQEDRVKEAFAEIKKLKPAEPEVIKKPKREARHRMGHYPSQRLSSVSFRGR